MTHELEQVKKRLENVLSDLGDLKNEIESIEKPTNIVFFLNEFELRGIKSILKEKGGLFVEFSDKTHFHEMMSKIDFGKTNIFKESFRMNNGYQVWKDEYKLKSIGEIGFNLDKIYFVIY